MWQFVSASEWLKELYDRLSQREEKWVDTAQSKDIIEKIKKKSLFLIKKKKNLKISVGLDYVLYVVIEKSEKYSQLPLPLFTHFQDAHSS